ncbi:adenosylmethionine decarboxylase [Pararhodobacter zhoushanensis]|jgi:S-adenosylmethionine decarboxylase|uniref:S-adenosylmethionine decarboxylase proenzyme n=1 Tax=Pararhodobacter zhoushanensis TaxID=2479545 RepID=A0ABT3H1M6_9RHOB|nr:adenosylmethionine decarboxylase [Pararhodobacter zhoushanensis]MCW1933749.1 adenosylmethionine decarboxylase [Pararhodobacter zhoushanensis]
MTCAPYSPGLHLILDLFGAEALTESERLETTLTEAARRAGASVLATQFRAFSGGGVTGMVLLAESHISIHTWPEMDFAAVDIFMCGAAKPEAARDWIEACLRPKRVVVHRIARGAVQLNQASQPSL